MEIEFTTEEDIVREFLRSEVNNCLQRLVEMEQEDRRIELLFTAWQQMPSSTDEQRIARDTLYKTIEELKKSQAKRQDQLLEEYFKFKALHVWSLIQEFYSGYAREKKYMK